MTFEQLQEMTRSKQASKVCRCLDHMKIAYRPGQDGKPLVLVSTVNAAFSAAKPRRGAAEPNFSFLKEPNRGKTPQRSRRAA